MLASLCEGYTPDDIFNMNKMGICFQVTEKKIYLKKIEIGLMAKKK